MEIKVEAGQGPLTLRHNRSGRGTEELVVEIARAVSHAQKLVFLYFFHPRQSKSQVQYRYCIFPEKIPLAANQSASTSWALKATRLDVWIWKRGMVKEIEAKAAN